MNKIEKRLGVTSGKKVGGLDKWMGVKNGEKTRCEGKRGKKGWGDLELGVKKYPKKVGV